MSIKLKLPIDICLQFPLTSACNLRCIGCPRQNEKLSFSKLFFDISLIERILGEVKYFKSSFSFLPIWLGEPFLHPQVEDIFNLIADKLQGNSYFSGMIIHTNGVYFNFKYITTFIKKKIPLEIVFSLDAVDSKEYFYIKRRNCYHRVVENIVTLLAFLKEMRNPDLLKTTVQFLVFKKNWKSSKKFIDFWKAQYKYNNLPVNIVYNPYSYNNSEIQHKIVIRRAESSLEFQDKYELLHNLSLKRAHVFQASENKKRIVDVASSSKSLLKESINICPAPFKFLLIDERGDVFFCWKDKRRELKVGNLYQNSLIDILNSNSYINFLKAHYLKKVDNYPLCSRCNGFDVAPLSEEEKKRIEKFLWEK